VLTTNAATPSARRLGKLQPRNSAHLICDGNDGPAARNPSATSKLGREIFQFVVAWVSCGGPLDDEVLPRLAMSSERLEQQVSEITAQSKTLTLSSDDRELLLRVVDVPGYETPLEPMSAPLTAVPHELTSLSSREDDAPQALGNQRKLRRGVWRWG
jgi:hypothetical protein